MALSKTTKDHNEIQQWAEARGAKPAEVASTEVKGRTGILRLEFPNATNANDSALKEISWDEFFEKFDASGLALVYQEQTADGEQSNFNKLIYPEDAPSGSSTAKKSPAAKSSGRKSASSKAASRKSEPAERKSGRALKAASTKAVSKKTPAKKAAAKKTAAKQTAGRKTAAKKTTAKKAPPKKTTARKAPQKKAGLKQPASRKSPASRSRR